MSVPKVNIAATEIFIFTSILFLSLLTSINIENYLDQKKVLGVETKINTEEIFWTNFLTNNPSYIPGWIEIGRMDKVREIDPNYEVTSSVLP